MPTIDIPDIWVPSPENIRALPLALRRFIEALQKEEDPEYLRAENYWLMETNIAYKGEIERLTALLRKAGIDPSEKKRTS
jgi:hypothetical protein